jgi:uncharacterized protein YjiS (DUF1127 family)
MMIAAMFGTVERYLRYQTQLVYIEVLDERLLRDIGCTRGELCSEAWDHLAAAAAR